MLGAPLDKRVNSKLWQLNLDQESNESCDETAMRSGDTQFTFIVLSQETGSLYRKFIGLYNIDMMVVSMFNLLKHYHGFNNVPITQVECQKM